MKFKPIPQPPDQISTLKEAQQSIPMVPSTETNCCSRLVSVLNLSEKDVARTWLTFLRALKLVQKSNTGYTRTTHSPLSDSTRWAFITRVIGVQKMLAILWRVQDPVREEQLFSEWVDIVPEWERQKSAHWQQTWRQRLRRIVRWATLFDLIDNIQNNTYQLRE
ncbi:MAG: hypothetical protein ABEI06_02725 [Halobacteriaceae archaeon]